MQLVAICQFKPKQIGDFVNLLACFFTDHLVGIAVHKVGPRLTTFLRTRRNALVEMAYGGGESVGGIEIFRNIGKPQHFLQNPSHLLLRGIAVACD